MPPASDFGSPITYYSVAATPAVGGSVGVGGTLGLPIPGINRVGRWKKALLGSSHAGQCCCRPATCCLLTMSPHGKCLARTCLSYLLEPPHYHPPATLHHTLQRLFTFLASQLKPSTCYGFTASATNAICTGGNASARYEFCTAARWAAQLSCVAANTQVLHSWPVKHCGGRSATDSTDCHICVP